MTLSPIIQAAIYAAVSFYDPLNPHIGGNHAVDCGVSSVPVSSVNAPCRGLGAPMKAGITKPWGPGPWCYGLVWFKGIASWAVCQHVDTEKCQRLDTCIVTDGFCG